MNGRLTYPFLSFLQASEDLLRLHREDKGARLLNPMLTHLSQIKKIVFHAAVSPVQLRILKADM
jgi:hypothetical protein